ncbi:MAG: hypothetical protein ABI594_13640 [Ginsengibacter sp.]
MKKIMSYATGIILSLFIISSQSCSKKKENNSETECKTCKAFPGGGQPEVSQQVCSDGAEQTFRSQHSGEEISCR